MAQTYVTYNANDLSKYITPEDMDRFIAEIESTTIPGTFSGTFAEEPVMVTITVRFTVRTYTTHCNKHLRNRLRLAPYRRPVWGVN